MENFVLIDGNSLINRAYYATPPMNTAENIPTNAVYAFLNMLIRIISDISPKYMLVAFDRHEPTFRKAIYNEYKGTRKPSPDDLHTQIALLKTVLDDIGIANYSQPGFEADDIIGTLSKKYDDLNSIIFTGDKDSFQLVNKSCEVHFTKRGISDIDLYNNDNFAEKVGINPIQIIDLKSLMGDSSDNIPGVAGVGEKTAISLVQQYGSLENVYEHIDEIKGKLQEKLISSKENAFMSKTLATIKNDMEISIVKENLTYKFPFSEKAREVFTKLEFKNLLKKDSLFFEDKNVVSSDKFDKVNIVNISAQNEIMSFIKTSKYSVVISDFISFYDFDNNEVFLNIKQDFFSDGFQFDEAILTLKPIFENENNTVFVYGKNQLRHLLEKNGVKFLARCEDASILKYLVDYSGKDEKLQDVFTYYGLPTLTPAYALSLLFNILNEKMGEDEKKLYYDLELPLCDVLYDMEREGFKIDLNELNAMSQKYKAKIDELLTQIISIAGEEFNPSSPKQLGVILFEKLGLKHGKKNKNGYSTSADVLEDLAEEHEIIPLILKYRQYSKILSTYIEGYRTLIDRKTGLVHTTFNQTQTSTGRLSSREPNLQNIPIRDEEGKEIRRLFSSRDENHTLIDADYSQIELRLLAHFSGCEPLIEAFNSGVDIHSVTASQVFEVDREKVTKEMRRSAKAVNFGIIYGISDFGLAKNLKISPKVASKYIARYFEMYPKVHEYMDANVQFARKTGYAETLLKRKRYIREINSANFNLRSFGERAAMNMPLQGSSADIIKLAMIKVYNELNARGLKSKLILQVHDELIIDALKSEVDEVKSVLVDCMENAVKLSVPLTVEVSVCDNWYDAK